MKDTMTLRSTITPQVLRFVLVRGSIVGGIGLLFLIYGGLFLPEEQLTYWGFPLFLLGMTCITLGLIPYRKLWQLQGNPHKLAVQEEGFTLFLKDKPTFSVPIAMISKISYLESGNQYGIGCWIDKDREDKIQIHQPGFDMGRFHRAARKRFGCDLFLPYFSQHTCKELEEVINPTE